MVPGLVHPLFLLELESDAAPLLPPFDPQPPEVRWRQEVGNKPDSVVSSRRVQRGISVLEETRSFIIYFSYICVVCTYKYRWAI